MIINKNHFCVCRCSSLLDVTWQYLNIYFLLIRPECDWAHEKWRGFIRQAMKQWTYSCRFKNHIIRKTNIHHLHINKDLALSYLTRFWFLLIAVFSFIHQSKNYKHEYKYCWIILFEWYIFKTSLEHNANSCPITSSFFFEMTVVNMSLIAVAVKYTIELLHLLKANK